MGKVVKTIVGAALTVASFFTGPAGIFLRVGGAVLLSSGLRPRVKAAALSTLQPQINPVAFRAVVFGRTALPLTLYYYEPSGSEQEYMDYILLHAGHALQSVDEIWFEDRLAWSSSAGVQAYFSGYLAVATRIEGAPGNAVLINGGARWGSTDTLTGCGYTHLRIKRTGNSKKAESPLVSGLPARVTVIGDGLAVYDPRLDSTVGGAGSHRAGDQTTWGGDRENTALQILAFLLGWRINAVLSVGLGVQASRIDMASFISAANLCDEPVALSGGGTQPRYRSAGVASEGDDPQQVLESLLKACGGELYDISGLLSLRIAHNDLSAPVVSLSDSDVLSDFAWSQTPPIAQRYNVVRGQWTDPSSTSLYQLVDYPDVVVASPDGIERALSLSLDMTQDAARAQRLAKQFLQRRLYQGRFDAEFSIRAWVAQVGDVVSLTFGATGFISKLFRVETQAITDDGRVAMRLLEEHSSIYAWDREESAVVQTPAPTLYDPLNNPFILGLGEVEGGAGVTTVFIFQRSASAPATPSGSGVPAGWSLAVPSGTAPLWTSIGYSTTGPPVVTVASWEAPYRVEGQDGAPGADAVQPLVVTASPQSISVQALASGSVKAAQLPRAIAYDVRAGGVDVKASSTIGGLVTSGCTASISGNAVTVTAVSATTAHVQVTWTYGGQAVTARTEISKVYEGSAGAVASTLANADIATSASYAQMGSTLALNVGSSGSILVSGRSIYVAAGLGQSTAVQIKMEFRPLAGSWAMVAGSEVMGPGVTFDPEIFGGPGEVSTDEITLPGLTAGAPYELRLMARWASGNAAPSSQSNIIYAEVI